MDQYFTSISISELQQWLADDQLIILRARITRVSTAKCDAFSFKDAEELLARLPAFSVDDESGVLIAKIGEPQTWIAHANPELLRLPLSRVEKFLPLTENSKEALHIRFGALIKPFDPCFEEVFTKFKYGIKSQSAEKAGQLLIDHIIRFNEEKPVNIAAVSRSLGRALMAAEYRRPEEIDKAFNNGVPQDSIDCLELAFGYTRREPLQKYGNRSSLYDIGLIFKERSDKQKNYLLLKEEFKKKCPNIFDSYGPSALDEVLSDSSLIEFDQNVSSEYGNELPISIISLALFLRWKQAYHDAGGRLNIPPLKSDINQLKRKIDINYVLSALWLLGAYVGLEVITPFSRAFHRSSYPALQAISDFEFDAQIEAWEMPIKINRAEASVNSSDEVEVAGVSGQSSESSFAQAEQAVMRVNSSTMMTAVDSSSDFSREKLAKDNVMMSVGGAGSSISRGDDGSLEKDAKHPKGTSIDTSKSPGRKGGRVKKSLSVIKPTSTQGEMDLGLKSEDFTNVNKQQG